MPTVTEYTPDELAVLGLDAERLPRHVAVIMDGNGRWARSKWLPRIEGHRRGVRSVRLLVEECSRLGLEQVTLYCLSSENWKRPQRELDMLMHLLEQYVVEERSEILRQNLRFSIIGRREGLSRGVLDEVEKTIALSADNTGTRLCLAVNYGSRGEIVDAIRAIGERIRSGEIDPADVDEEVVAGSLYTAGMPDPDLLVRTSGELRISNYLLWQISYAELWVTEKHWPEFRPADLYEALRDYQSRDRRYGGLTDDV